MNRRESLLALLALGSVPRATMAKTSAEMSTLGYLSFEPAQTRAEFDRSAFAIRLGQLGWVEGRNLRVERASAEGNADRLKTLAAELVAKRVDLIYAIGPNPAVEAALATEKIPIVFLGPTFPVEMGLVDSYARPGRNVTGVAWSDGIEVYIKLLEFIRELTPAATRVAYFSNPTTLRKLSGGYLAEVEQKVEAAGRKIGIELRGFPVLEPGDFATAFKAIEAWRPHALYTVTNPITAPAWKSILGFAANLRLPSYFDSQGFVAGGGLFSYGPEVSQLFVQAAGQVDRILRGASPAGVPVEMPTRYELVINRKTAGNLGISIPQGLLLRADKVIE